ncbi:hypothetical protein [Cytobacillus oceanisediminis]|uniref:Uncharacterized protein n=1 Tax=Cytobacillus oceanisediminis 2691 TaxID=1196031 RepID=A0A160M9X2_9BACI|nr:hypothetical protein [Cytobacillus oceanisediminis]AND39536.1 hypothetical protein A361_10455 [Cytobacillus oceanisediminis 2691]
MAWREDFYNKVRKEKLGQSMKTYEDVINFIKNEFTKLAEPIKSDTSIDETKGYYTFSVLDKNLEINNERNKIIFYKNIIDPEGRDAALKFNEFSLVDGIYCVMIDNHPVKIDETIIDSIFKKAFYLQG